MEGGAGGAQPLQEGAAGDCPQDAVREPGRGREEGATAVARGSGVPGVQGVPGWEDGAAPAGGAGRARGVEGGGGGGF